MKLKKVLLFLYLLFNLNLYAGITTCPGSVVSSLDGTTSDVTKRIYNVSVPRNTIYYYSFTPAVDGTIKVTTRASRSTNKLYIKDGCSGAVLWSKTNSSNNKYSPKVGVRAGQRIVVAFERNYRDPLTIYNIKFVFKKRIRVGCDNSLDTSSNYNNPGNIINGMNGITSSKLGCISGELTTNNTEYYKFTVQAKGTLNITTSSPTGTEYSMGVSTSQINNIYWMPGAVYPYSDGRRYSSHSISAMNLEIGDTVYLVFKSYSSNTKAYQVNFNFSKLQNTPPQFSTISDINVEINNPISINLSSFVTELDGDTITYSATGLPAGATINTNTGVISGTPTSLGRYNITVIATDKDGSDSKSFIIKVLQAPVANAGTDKTVMFRDTFSFDGSNSRDPDGIIVSYQWKEGSTVLGTGVTLTNNTLSIGVHNITLTITDNDGLTSTDTVVITIIKACHGCDCSLDTDANNRSTGVLIPALNGVTNDTNTCISGESDNDVRYNQDDYYHFRVQTDGLLKVKTNSPNGHSYHLKIGSSSNGNEYYRDRTAQSHNVSDIRLSAGDSVYIYISETGSGVDEYEINFEFKKRIIETCPGVTIPNLEGTSVTATDNFRNVTVYNNSTYYYNFTPNEQGTIEVNTRASRATNKLYILDGCNGSVLWSNVNNSNNKSSPKISVRKSQKIVVKFFRNYNTNLNLDIDFIYTVILPSPPRFIYTPKIPNQNIDIGNPFSLSILPLIREDDGDTITYSATGLPAGLSINSSTGIISGNPTTANTYTVAVKVSDKDGDNTATFTIITTIPPLNAVNDTFATAPSASLTANALLNDTGANITVISHSSPAYGTLTIQSNGVFVYTPSGTSSEDTFTYTIRDSFGQTDTAIVKITANTIYKQGIQDFILVNPPSTRNITGGYVILGNTIECITNKKGDSSESNSYGGACQDGFGYNDNNYMSKYLDIDGNTGRGLKTWNSSSSNFTLPNSFEPNGGQGILWAGLFWQGSINNKASKKQRRAYVDGNSYLYNNINSSSRIDLENTNGNKLLMRIDSDLDYTPVQASTFYYDKAHGSYGGYYASYTDITGWLQSKNLLAGKHTITVANITANEGRQTSTGNYAGWSIVVIYKSNNVDGDSTNVSIYSGYTTIPNKQEVKISGFRLPKLGKVNAKFSSFAGEGEEVYKWDRMVMKRVSSDAGDTMPNARDADNIFDARLANIDRDTLHDNDVQNANGIDIDSYDVSSILTRYRDADPLISSVYISLSSSGDYITPSMMAFSTALYKPNICYDYTFDIEGYVIDSENNKIRTGYGSYNVPLTTRISIKSKEGDFPLKDVNISFKWNDATQLRYINESTAVAPKNIYDYIPAGLRGLNRTYNQTIKGFSMYIGNNANTQPFGPGGVITSYETRYLKFNTRMLKSSIDTGFTFWMDYNVDYGSGDVHLVKGFGPSDICSDNAGYTPAWGIFNVSSDETNVVNGTPYNLYTQISNRDFNAKIFAYDSSYSSLSPRDTAIEVEVFNAGLFTRDINISCYNPDSNISHPVFVDFKNQSSVLMQNLRYDLAIRNAGFRTWHLNKIDGTLVSHHCLDRNDESCFRTVYQADYSSDTNCQTDCSSTGSGCYSCLRRYYGKLICSRDNFAIRPEAFKVTLVDSKQSNDTLLPSRIVADSISTTSIANTANLSSDYNYRFDTVATNFLNDNPTKGYIQTFNKTSNALSQMLWDPRRNIVTGCIDTQDKNVSATLFHGTNINGTISSSLVKVNQVGRYKYVINDSNWTSVDWLPEYLVHHQRRGFSTTDDCIRGGLYNTLVRQYGGIGRHGCIISNEHRSPTSKIYSSLDLEFYPYSFDTTGLTIGAGPNMKTNSRDIVYMNTLGSGFYPNGIDENMSFNIIGTFRASGFNGGILSNFVNNCYAKDIVMTLNHRYISTPPTTRGAFTYDLMEYNNTQTRRNFTFSNASSILSIDDPARSFAREMNGSLSIDLGFNFNRDLNLPLNPRVVKFTDFNITLKSPTLLNTNLVNNKKTFGSKDINQTISFIYARVKMSKFYYENIRDSFVKTPISVVNYCSLGVNECLNRGIDTAFGQTNEATWWLSTSHQTSQKDGDIVIDIGTIIEGVGSHPTLSPKILNIISNGEDDSIIVGRGTNPILPLTVPIKLITNTSLPDYTSRWLLYNPDSVKFISNVFYKVRFIGNSMWTGVGDTGSVVGTEANTQNHKRLDW